MPLECNRCYLQNCTYTTSQNYNPQKGIATRSPADYPIGDPIWIDHGKEPLEKIYQIYQNCKIINSEDIFYFESDGQLSGCSKFDLPTRIYLFFLNYWSGGESELKTVQKIEETFRYILQIGKGLKTRNSPTDNPDIIIKLEPTHIFLKKTCVSLHMPYTILARKILASYSKHTALKELAIKIIHERPYNRKN